MSNNHFTKKSDCRLTKIIASFGDGPVNWSKVETQFNNKRHKRSQRSAAGLQTRWRALQKKAKQESLKRIAQKDGFESWFAQLIVGVKKLREQKKIDEDKIVELEARIKVLERERNNAIREHEAHLEKDERIRDEAKRLAQAALAVNGD